MLLHGFGAGSSGFQWRRNAPALADYATVFNVDLLGWGRSDRPRLHYGAELYVRLISDLLAERVAGPAVLVGSFQTAAYAIAVAARHPELVRGLVLQTPTGLSYLRGPGLRARLFYAALFYTPLSTLLYNLISSRDGTRNFMRRYMYTRPELVDEEMVAGFYDLARLPGGRWGAVAFLTRQLNLSVERLLPLVRCPALVIWGDRTAFVPPSEARAFADRLPDARSIVLGPAGIWLNDERAEQWNQAVTGFLGTLRG